MARWGAGAAEQCEVLPIAQTLLGKAWRLSYRPEGSVLSWLNNTSCSNRPIARSVVCTSSCIVKSLEMKGPQAAFIWQAEQHGPRARRDIRRAGQADERKRGQRSCPECAIARLRQYVWRVDQRGP